MSFLTINNLKNKEKEMKQYLENRNKIKNDFTNQKLFNYELKEEKEKLFEPVTNTLNKNSQVLLMNQKRLTDFQNINQSNVMKEIKSLKQPRLLPYTPSPLPKLPALPEPIKPVQAPQPIKVSQLISSYLSDGNNKSTAGYSIRYHPDKNKFSIGNSYIQIRENTLIVKNNEFNATEGLMELLVRSTPDMSKIDEDDLKSYKQILDDTNAIYIGFDKLNRVIPFNNGSKYKLLREKLFPEILKKTGGSIEFLPSDPNELVNQLKLSVSSFQAGNNGEYNRINSIIDSLLKTNIISNQDSITILKNLFN